MFFHISISFIVAVITKCEFSMHVFNLLACVGTIHLSSPQYVNVQDMITHLGSFIVTFSGSILWFIICNLVSIYVIFSWE